MRILIISHDSGSSDETNVTGIYPPLGLAYIASALRNSRHEVGFLDNRIARLKGGSLKNEIKRAGPDAVLLSSMTPSWPESVNLSRIIKAVSGRIIIGVGGPHLTVYPEESLAVSSFDFGVYGEGERTILEILDNISYGRGLEDVKGCISRKNGKVIVAPPREPVDNLDAIAFPAVDLLPVRDYFALSVRSPFFSMVTSRGCPYTCRFCFQGYLGKYRSRSPENVVEEMELLVNKYGMREIIVFDETFAVEEDRALEICELIRKKKIKFKWDLRTRIDLLNQEILGSLKSAGCFRMHLGIESGNQEILNKMDKGISIPEVVKKINLAKKFGFELRGYFMLGFPGETRRSICETIEFAKSLPLDWASFTVTIGLPQTDIYTEALGDGYFHIDYWREYVKGRNLNSRPYFIPRGFRESELLAFKRRAYLEFYLRPKIILNMIKNSRLVDVAKNFHVFLKLSPSIYHSIAQI